MGVSARKLVRFVLTCFIVLALLLRKSLLQLWIDSVLYLRNSGASSSKHSEHAEELAFR
jgi:hypothetical protein